MDKSSLKSWNAVAAYARERGYGSLNRGDPIACAYWKETVKYALRMAETVTTRDEFVGEACRCVGFAKDYWKAGGDYMHAALWYSRAKWNVIVARAKGWTMGPRDTGVNLRWLEDAERPIVGQGV